jgi:hypothetical protein
VLARASHACASDGVDVVQVCMHIQPYENEQRGKCVRATSRWVPSFSTRLTWVPCTTAGCTTSAFRLTNEQNATAFERKHSLPPDPVWTETYNEPIQVVISLRDSSSMDSAILVAGILVTAMTVLTVLTLRKLYSRHLKQS